MSIVTSFAGKFPGKIHCDAIYIVNYILDRDVITPMMRSSMIRFDKYIAVFVYPRGRSL